MNVIFFIDIAAFIATISTFYFLGCGRGSVLSRDAWWILLGLIGLNFFHHMSNVFEWSGITNTLDRFEDYSELLVPIVYFIFVFAVLRERSISALKESEERFKAIYERSNHMVYMHDFEGNMLDANEAALEKLGYLHSDIRSVKFENLIKDPKKITEAYESINEILQVGYNKEAKKFELITKEGNSLWIQVKGSLLYKDGKPNAVIGTAEDITAHKQAEEELQKLALVIKHSSELVNLATLDGNMIFLNRAGCKMLGISPDEVEQYHIMEVIPDHLKELVENEVLKALMQGDTWEGDLQYRNVKTGKLTDVHAMTFTVKEPNTDKVLFLANVSLDITERKALEDKIRQAQKMEAIGTLAGGIAHDFNNLLMAIIGYNSVMMLNTDSTHPNYKHLSEIEKCIESASELTRQLLGFARGGKYEVKTTDLNQLIKDHNRMFSRTKKEITIHGRYEKNLWATEVDRGQIGQVFMNIYVNAWQAMPDGGELHIQTENVNIEKDFISPFEFGPGRYIKISITDTGIGMDEETKKRIFDPFFTTKEKERGTGMGLSSAYGIIKNHGGFITVSSELGEGSTFNIFLPASNKEKKVKNDIKPAKKILKGSGTILLIDDERIILNVGEHMLNGLGYDVITAKDGKEGLKIYRENHEKIDMIILDMIMPGTTAGDVYDGLKEINQDTKVLLSSGYSINDKANDILKRGCDGFIQKPFNLEQLSQKINEILSKA